MKTYKPLKKIYLDLLVISIGFGVLGYLFKFPYLYALSGIAILSAIHPRSAGAVSYAWEKFGKFWGKVNSTIILAIFYVVFITPFSILYRFVGKKKMAENSHWSKSEYKTDFNKPY